MQISPDTLQPVPPGTAPALGAASGTIVIYGVAAVELRLYKPGAAEPLVTLDAWTPTPATGAYTATLTLEQADAILAAGPTLHASVNGGPPFQVKNSGSATGPSNPGSGGSNPGPGAGYYTKDQVDQLITDIVAPAGGTYALTGPGGLRAVHVRRADGKLIPVVGAGTDDAPAIAAAAPVTEAQPEA
ncbi:hypothetical protein OPIT5_29275 [Opitutaceae bacterium TAV5]|nr:hypothetical protein OPIT5_29275 [Opitutaceae bacterium TAV5]